MIALLCPNLNWVTLKPSRVLSVCSFSYLVLLQSKIFFLQYHFLQVHFSDFNIFISFSTRMFELCIEFIPSLYCYHNLVIKPRFWIDLYSDLFCWSYVIYCSYKSIYEIWISIIYTSLGQIVWKNDLTYSFQKLFWGISWANKYLMFMGFGQVCDSSVVNQVVIRELPVEFISIWSIKVTVWAVTLVAFVIICYLNVWNKILNLT